MALGQRGEDCWPEIWPIIYPQIEAVMTRGEASWHENQLVPIHRNGRLEDVYWTYGYSPVYASTGEIGGTLVVCTETTDTILARQLQQREMERLADLFEQAPAFFAVLDGPEYVFEMMNGPYQQLIGHRSLLGKSVREAVPEAEGQGFLKLLDGVYHTGKPYVGRRHSHPVGPHSRSSPRIAIYGFRLPAETGTGWLRFRHYRARRRCDGRKEDGTNSSSIGEAERRRPPCQLHRSRNQQSPRSGHEPHLSGAAPRESRGQAVSDDCGD
jgi:PAS domain-containing protein